MDYFGYFNAETAGRNAGAGIYSSARWASERDDGFPPPADPLDTRYQLRYVRSRLGSPVDMRALASVLVEVDVAVNGVEVPTPVYQCPPTRKRSRKQSEPKRGPRYDYKEM